MPSIGSSALTSAQHNSRDARDDVSSNSGKNQSNKSRKPYTITKQRETWTDDEHTKFLEALKHFDRDWRKIEQFIGTKSVIQIRSHAQKYFLKVQKNGTGEHVPPPRSKRKAHSSHDQPDNLEDEERRLDTNLGTLGALNPYMGDPSTFATWLVDSGRAASESSVRSSLSLGSVHHPVVTLPSTSQLANQEFLLAQPFLHQVMESATAQYSRQNASAPSANFARIYAFLGGLFDSSPAAHLENYNAMSSTDREIVKSMTHMLAISLATKQYQSQQTVSSMLERYKSIMQTCITHSIKAAASRKAAPIVPRSWRDADRAASGTDGSSQDDESDEAQPAGAGRGTQY